jgi:hypothetical protein
MPSRVPRQLGVFPPRAAPDRTPPHRTDRSVRCVRSGARLPRSLSYYGQLVMVRSLQNTRQLPYLRPPGSPCASTPHTVPGSAAGPPWPPPPQKPRLRPPPPPSRRFRASTSTHSSYPGRQLRHIATNLAGVGSTTARLGRRRATPPALPLPRPRAETGPGAPLGHSTPVPGRPRRRTSPEFHRPHRPPPPRTTLQGIKSFQGVFREPGAYS